MDNKPDTNFTNLHRLITAVILVLFVSISNVYSFTNRPSKPPVGARIDPLHPMSRDLVAWWLFNDGSGSSLLNITGKYPGSLTNMDANDWVGSPRGGGLDFDGAGDYVDMGLQPDLRFNSGNFTITGWVKPDIITGLHVLVANYIDSTRGYIFSIYTSKLAYFSGAWHYGNTVLSAGIWYHIVVTVDSSGNYIFYLNGKSDGSGASALPPANEDTFKIGAYNAGGASGWFDGLIDDIHVYNRVLLADEVAELYRNPYVGLIKPNPVKWYGVDDPAASFTPTVTWW